MTAPGVQPRYLSCVGTMPMSGTLLYIGVDAQGVTCGFPRRHLIVGYVALGRVWKTGPEGKVFLDDDEALAKQKPPATRNTPFYLEALYERAE